MADYGVDLTDDEDSIDWIARSRDEREPENGSEPEPPASAGPDEKADAVVEFFDWLRRG